MWGAVRNDSGNSREAFGSVETSILCTVHLRDGRCRLRRKSKGCSEHSERRTSPAQERECSPASGQRWTHTRGQAGPQDKSRGVVDLGARRRAWPLEKKRTVYLAISRFSPYSNERRMGTQSCNVTELLVSETAVHVPEE